MDFREIYTRNSDLTVNEIDYYLNSYKNGFYQKIPPKVLESFNDYYGLHVEDTTRIRIKNASKLTNSNYITELVLNVSTVEWNQMSDRDKHRLLSGDKEMLARYTDYKKSDYFTEVARSTTKNGAIVVEYSDGTKEIVAKGVIEGIADEK